MTRKGRKYAFLVAVLSSLAMILSLLGFGFSAVSAEKPNSVTAYTHSTVQQGNTGYCYIYIDSLESLSSLTVAVHYDSNKISVTSSFNQVDCLLYDSKVNSDYIQYSYILDGNGENAQTQLFYFQYQVLSDVPVGNTYFDIVVSDAYDASLNVLPVSGSRYTFAITAKATQKYCYIYGTSSLHTSVNRTFALDYRLNTIDVASGSVVIQYDPELFEVKSVSPGAFLDGKILDINTSLAGAIYISFVGTEKAADTNFLKVEFKTLKNVTASSYISLSATELYDLNLNSYTCDGYSTSAQVDYDTSYADNAPCVELEAVYLPDRNQVAVTVNLDANSKLGAGDFALTFDEEYFRYHSAIKEFTPTFFNINHKEAAKGLLKFSIISLSDIKTEETMITVYFDVLQACESTRMCFQITGSGLADSMTNPIVLNFVDTSIAVPGHTPVIDAAVPPTCTETGLTQGTHCAVCSAILTAQQTIPALGHDEIPHEYKAPTCTEIGWEAYETCSRCDYSTYDELSALGHDRIYHDYKAPTCTEVGWNTYETCSRCDYSTYDELSVLGHDRIYHDYKAPTCTEIGWEAYETCSRCDYSTYSELSAIGHSYMNKHCVRCEADQPVTYSWDASANQDGSVMAYCYADYNGDYRMEIVGSGRMKDWQSYNVPWSGIREHIRYLTIGEDITYIGYYSFYQCVKLEEVTIPANITNIGNYAFRNCFGLKKVIFNATAMNETFSDIFNQAGLNSGGFAVVISKDVTKISGYLFYGAANLISVEFEAGSVCRSIDAHAFSGCKNLESIVIPKSVTRISNNAFNGCSALQSVTFEAGSTCEWIESGAFQMCASLTEIEIPKQVSYIGSYAFWMCTALQNVYFEDGSVCEHIGSSVFSECTSLESIMIPENVVTVGQDAFNGCTALKEVVILAKALNDINYGIFSNAGQNSGGFEVIIGKDVTKIPAYFFYEAIYLTGVEFEEGSACQSIGNNAFEDCHNLESITIPEQITSIGNYAFRYCYALKKVVFNAVAMNEVNSALFEDAGMNSGGFEVFIGKDVTKIPAYMFYYANYLTGVEFEEGSVCQSIGNYAFENCFNLESVTILEQITSIGNYAFRNCYALKEVVFNAVAMNGKNTNLFQNAGKNSGGFNAIIGKNVTQIPDYLFKNAAYLAVVEYEPGSICESIGAYAFNGCSSLKSITIPEGVTNIGYGAFLACTGLEEVRYNAISVSFMSSECFVRVGEASGGFKVIIGKNVTMIPSNMFQSAIYLESVEFEAGSVCETIGSHAFYGCKNLADMIISNCVTSIGSYAFYGCSSLKSITIPENVTAIGDYALTGCTALEEVVFHAIAMDNVNGNVFTRSGQDSGGFKVFIGKNVTKIPANLFFNAYYLESVEFEAGSVCESIGSSAFFGCTSLESIIIPRNIKRIGGSAFYGCTALTNVEFEANSLCESIGSASFGSCTSLEDVVIPRNVKIIEDMVFNGCTALKKVEFEADSLCETFKNSAFYGCTSLESITIPKNIQSIQDHVFEGCAALKEVKFQAIAMNDLNNEIFSNAGQNSGGIKLIIGKDVTKIPAYLFYNSTYLVSVEFEEGSACESIGSSAFYGCSGLNQITLPESVKVIGENAFRECSSLSKFVISDSVTSIGYAAFYQCYNLRIVYIHSAEIASRLTSYESCGYISSNARTIVISSPATYFMTVYFPHMEEITFDGEAYTICSVSAHSYELVEVLIERIPCVRDGCLRYACSTCGVQKDVTVFRHDVVNHSAKAPTCTEIGWNAYDTCAECDYSTYVELSALGHDRIYHDYKAPTCTEVGWNAYETCSRCDYSTYDELSALDHDRIYHDYKAPTCTEVGWNAYETCSRCDYSTYDELSALDHDRIYHDYKAPTCTEIGWEAHETCSRCDYTTYVEISALGHSYKDKICVRCEGDQPPSYSWDISVAQDGSVMAHCYEIENGYYLMEIVGSGDMMDWLYSAAPWNVIGSQIKTVTIAGEVNNIGAYAFYSMTALENVTISDGVKAIGNNAISYCNGLKLIYLPDSIDSIGDYAFYDCNRLTIILKGDELPSELGSIWYYGTGYYLNPQKVIMCNDCTYVIDRNGEGYLAKYFGDGTDFEMIGSIDGIAIRRIGDFAFSNADTLLTFTVPKEIISVGTYAFRECDRLTILFESATLPPQMGGTWYGDSGYYLNPQAVIVQDDRTYVVAQNGELYLAKYFGTASNVVVEETINGMPTLHIGDYAFVNNYDIVQVTLPDTIRKIGQYAFRGSMYLKAIELPDSITEIGEMAFFYCRDLTSIHIPSQVTAIHSSAFSYCVSIETVVIYEGATYIASNAFNHCDNLKLVYIRSEAIAESITSSTAGGNLCENAVTVVIPADSVIENGYLENTYSVSEYALVDGMSAVIYSLHQHVWVDTIIEEMIPCESDGLIIHTCTLCGVQKETIIDCHTLSHHAAKAPTCTEIGWDAYETCSDCGYSTYEEIPALGHTESAVGYDDQKHWSICATCEEIYDEVAHSFQSGTCDCGAKQVIVSATGAFAYTISGQTVTVWYITACRVGYLMDGNYVAIEAIANADGSYSFTAPEEVTEVLIVTFGDMDGDGAVDTDDLDLLARSLMPADDSMYVELTAEQRFAADVNGNGVLNSADRALLARSLLESTHRLYQALAW